MAITMASIQSGAGKVMAPVKVLGDIFIGTGEKMMTMQLESSKVYQDIAFKQLKKFSTVRNLEQAGDFVWGQIEPLSAVNKQLLADWKSMVALNTELTDGVKAAFTTKPKADDKVTSIFPEEKPAQPVTKAPAKRTTTRAKKTTT